MHNLSMTVLPFLVFLAFFSFIILYRASRTLGRGISPSQGRYLHAGQHKQNKRTQTLMSRVGFENKIPVFERTKIVHALDCTGTVIGVRLRISERTYTLNGAAP
jgi:hypothetical protein